MPDDRIPDYIPPEDIYTDYGMPAAMIPKDRIPDDPALDQKRRNDTGRPDAGASRIGRSTLQRLSPEQTVSSAAVDSAASASSQAEMSEEIWMQTIDEVSRQKGLFVRLVSRTSYQKVEADQVYIACADEATQSLLAGRAKSAVEQQLGQRLGRKLNVVPVIPKSSEASREADKAQQKETLEAFFGMDVDVR